MTESKTRQQISGKKFNATTLHAFNHHNTVFVDCDFSASTFSHCTLNQVELKRCNLTHTQWQQCQWHDVVWTDCAATHMTWQNCASNQTKMSGGDFSHLRDVSSSHAHWTLDQTLLHHSVIQASRISHFNAMDVQAHGLSYCGGALHDGSWFNGQLAQFKITDTDIQRFLMTGCEVLGLALTNTPSRHLNFHRSTVQDGEFSQLTIEGLACHESVLKQCDFHASHLSGAMLADARLEQCNFAHAVLLHARLDRATLSQCNFEQAQLSRASLKHLQASNTTFDHAVLDHADLRYAVLENTSFIAASLAHTRLHGTPTHTFPSQGLLTAQTHEPQLAKISAWYDTHAVGPTHLPPQHLGVKTYV